MVTVTNKIEYNNYTELEAAIDLVIDLASYNTESHGEKQLLKDLDGLAEDLFNQRAQFDKALLKARK